MIKLNLYTASKSDEIIKEYLENNVSETLAEKINNGVKITKDNVELINKKSLVGFMKFATEEAKKAAEKGATFACIDDRTVFGWAINYFEEDSIEGELFTLDGEEYKPKVEIPKVTQSAVYTPKPTVKVSDMQENLFDLMFNDNESKQENEATDEVIEDAKQEETTGVTVGEMYCCQDEKFPTTSEEIVDKLKSLFGQDLVLVR